MLSTDVATPAGDTRRSRRLAAAASSAGAADAHQSVPGYGPHVATVSVASGSTAVAAPTFEPFMLQTVHPPAATATTRRELRRRSAVAAPVAPILTAREVLNDSLVTQGGPSMTRRELRAAALAASGAGRAERAGSSATTSVATPAAVAFQQAQVEQPEAADQPVDLEFDFASVALTLSSLTAPSTVSNETVAMSAGPAVAEAPARDEAPQPVADDVPAVLTTLVPPVVPVPAPALAGAAGGGSTRVAAPTAGATGPRQWVPRLAVLSALGVATVVTPVLAVNQGGAPEAAPAPLADSSALDGLVPADGAAAGIAVAGASAQTGAAVGGSVDETASLLAADPMAEVRGVVAASRSEGRSDLPQCGAPGTDLPNGTLAALESTDNLLMSMPIQEGVYRVSSGFGPRWGAFHYATDFAAPLGTPIRAVAGGEVVHSGGGLAGRSPNLIAIRSEIDGETVEIWYNHMYDDGVFVEEGDTVEVGDIIGEVGNNGNSTGPHLHLEIHVGNVSDPNGSAVDPLPWLRAKGATPVTTTGAVCA
ncbi:hypothetical protein GCM10025875_06680 [Litorihabitans aurantiacus]|uniref:M23ase beta-sheet core domain-containing protein n=1 Tax=Litorihabitans aurantiacus TaxID=1930061 RepID=A0AA37XCV7_9MICO|nr:hypothetical protein GCM10025875_06680 [Litorihabitans aurantiacus]